MHIYIVETDICIVHRITKMILLIKSSSVVPSISMYAIGSYISMKFVLGLINFKRTYIDVSTYIE
jgi:hypothetical protein